MAKILVVLNGITATGESDKSISEMLSEQIFTLENASIGEESIELLFVRSASVSAIGMVDHTLEDALSTVSVIQEDRRNRL
ncbi:hypothetical protein [Deinococcus roseus]|uniref:Uncharacterized protein n=1 Tax=Deinococcus roseus TaxID=392414 RepID=A0ABQ2CVT5_9DEIO|nr:hypothetical protein [Deinococcus roseus]GGJ25864.1 hypothetical protein GCM10008938_09970 [Deinococcus roseus]